MRLEITYSRARALATFNQIDMFCVNLEYLVYARYMAYTGDVWPNGRGRQEINIYMVIAPRR